MPTLKHQAYKYIRNEMACGRLSGGDRLLPAELARQIGVSIIPVREAIGRLLSEGLVEQIPRRGVFVRQPNREELIELIEFRKILECSAASQAAKRIGDVELAELAGHLRDFQAAQTAIIDLTASMLAAERGEQAQHPASETIIDSLARAQLADLAFHLAIFRSARNRWVLKSMEDTNMMMRMFGYRTDPPDNWRNVAACITESVEIHQQIFAAISGHDPKAARRAMVLHMRRAKRNMLARFDWLRERQSSVESGEYPEETKEFSQSFRERVFKAQNLRIDEGHDV